MFYSPAMLRGYSPYYTPAMLRGLGSAYWDEQSGLDPYTQPLESVAPGVGDAMQSYLATGLSVVDAVAKAASAFALSDAQRRLLNIQMQRAAAGQPPLDSSQYGLGVSVGLGGDTQKLLMFGALGIAALFLLTKRGR